eukprot:295618-Pelagomonas_calceolata.AAC.2
MQLLVAAAAATTAALQRKEKSPLKAAFQAINACIRALLSFPQTPAVPGIVIYLGAHNHPAPLKFKTKAILLQYCTPLVRHLQNATHDADQQVHKAVWQAPPIQLMLEGGVVDVDVDLDGLMETYKEEEVPSAPATTCTGIVSVTPASNEGHIPDKPWWFEGFPKRPVLPSLVMRALPMDKRASMSPAAPPPAGQKSLALRA